MLSMHIVCQSPTKMPENSSSVDERTPSTVSSEASREMKRKMMLSVAAEPHKKKKKLDSPIQTTVEAQPECVAPLADTPRALSFSAEDFIQNCDWMSVSAITIPKEKKRGRADGSASKAKKRKMTSDSEADISDVGVIITDLPSPLYSRDDLQAKYCEEGVLNKGGFGMVYSGYRKSDNLPVALKHIPKPNLKSISMFVNGVRQDLPREVALMLKVKEVGKPSDNMVDLLEWCELPNELVLILERPVPCMDLYDYMDTKEGIMHEEKANRIIKQLVNGLITIHSRGVFHRDIKLENILVQTGTSAPSIWIIDFGCATLVSDCNNTIQGTAGYTPPEWFLHSIYHPEPTTVWQVGIVVYVMLHSCFPFDSKCAVKNEEPKVKKSLSNVCQHFLQRCLNKSPEDRATLEELKLHPWLI